MSLFGSDYFTTISSDIEHLILFLREYQQKNEPVKVQLHIEDVNMDPTLENMQSMDLCSTLENCVENYRDLKRIEQKDPAKIYKHYTDLYNIIVPAMGTLEQLFRDRVNVAQKEKADFQNKHGHHLEAQTAHIRELENHALHLRLKRVEGTLTAYTKRFEDHNL
jgi:hypothetical protein